MKEKSSTEMGRAQSDSTSLTLACRNGLSERHREREREAALSGDRPIIQEYNYCARDKDKGTGPDTTSAAPGTQLNLDLRLI